MKIKDFPLLNKTGLIYLDSAATTQKPACFIDSISQFYSDHNANVHRGIYDLSEKTTILYENARKTVAKYINSSPEEIIFTSGTTMSLNLLARYFAFENIKENQSIVLSYYEHHSNIVPWQDLVKLRNSKIYFLSLDQNQQPDINDLERYLKLNQPFAISISLMSNVTGTTPDIKSIRGLINRLSPNTYLIADAAQAIAHNKIDVKLLEIDFLTFSAHKLYGPMGLGVLYGKKDILNKISPFFKGGGMIESVDNNASTWSNIPNKFEAGTPPVAQACSFTASLEYINALGIEKIKENESVLTKQLFEEISKLGDFKILNKYNDQNGPIISIIHERIHAHDLAQLLNYENIAVRAGHHCAQLLHKKIFKTPASLRISLGLYNEEKDIEALLKALYKIDKKF